MELVTAVLVTQRQRGHAAGAGLACRRSGSRSSIWDNSSADLSVYGRYAAIEDARGDLIYVQDDDVIVSDPQAIVDAWKPGMSSATCRRSSGTTATRTRRSSDSEPASSASYPGRRLWRTSEGCRLLDALLRSE